MALRLIADREEEINAFVPEEYWTLDADFLADGGKKPLQAHFYGTKDGKMTVKSKEEMEQILKELDGVSYEVSEVKNGERVKKRPFLLQPVPCSRRLPKP